MLRNTCGLDLIRHNPYVTPVRAPQFAPAVLDCGGIEILKDPTFLASAQAVASHTILDLPRLANLWMLSRITNPTGAIIEVGTFRGGSARLLADACPDRNIFVCDTFQGFGDLPIDPKADEVFYREQFDQTSLAAVESLFVGDRHRVRLIQGFFPASDRANEVRDLSFAHLDVDLLQSMTDCLEYLESRFVPRSLIVLDDYRRSAHGVDQAAAQFVDRYPNWIALPVFPGQGLLVHRSWFPSSQPNTFV